MNNVHTVTEVINGTPSAPEIYFNQANADRAFGDLCKENGAVVHEGNEYRRVADCSPSGDYLVIVHYNVPMNG